MKAYPMVSQSQRNYCTVLTLNFCVSGCHCFLPRYGRKTGTPYPPKSLYILLAGILRHMRTLNKDCPNFLDTENKEFDKFHACLDNSFRQLRTDGFGSSSKHAEVLSKEEEALLWDKEVLGIGSPKQLLRAVFLP